MDHFEKSSFLAPFSKVLAVLPRGAGRRGARLQRPGCRPDPRSVHTYNKRRRPAGTNIYPAVQRGSSLHRTRYRVGNMNISELYLAFFLLRNCLYFSYS